MVTNRATLPAETNGVEGFCAVIAQPCGGTGNANGNRLGNGDEGSDPSSPASGREHSMRNWPEPEKRASGPLWPNSSRQRRSIDRRHMGSRYQNTAAMLLHAF